MAVQKSQRSQSKRKNRKNIFFKRFFLNQLRGSLPKNRFLLTYEIKKNFLKKA